MKRVEIESLIKSFVLFFVSLNVLSALIFYFVYEDARHNLEESLFMQMKLCSLDLKCERFAIDFEPSGTQQLHTLHKENDTLFALFPIPRSDRFVMKFTLAAEDYRREIGTIRRGLIWQYAGVIAAITLLSLLFSVYALHPLRRALKLTEEFVKDILHDVNTPLAALRLNLGMLRRDLGSNTKIERMEEGIERIVALQANLKSYLGEHALELETVALHELLADRMAWFEKLYPSIAFRLEATPLYLHANREALVRIIDNLLDNAAKYNVKGGRVQIELDAREAKLQIVDTGRGIKEPGRVFERFYKEHERGMGIGLNIVKKLCDAMGIAVTLQSEKGVGSRFSLDLDRLTLR